MREALMSTVCNMFRKQGQKAHEYPRKPFDFNATKELTEDEIKKKREAFVASLMVMKSNFDAEHKGGS